MVIAWRCGLAHAPGAREINASTHSTRPMYPPPGGLSRGSLTEVVGPAGVGKSQLCLTMCACAGLPEALGGLGEGTGVLFLDTEQKFSPHRVQEIAKQQVRLR